MSSVIKLGKKVSMTSEESSEEVGDRAGEAAQYVLAGDGVVAGQF